MTLKKLLFIQAFKLASTENYALRPVGTLSSKPEQMMNFEDYGDMLAGIAWDVHPGAPVTHGNWPLTTHEEFLIVAANRLPLVKEACESRKYDAVVLLGGGDPGFLESVEIAAPFGVAVTSCAYAQMHVARMLGRKFSVIDISEAHMARMRRLVSEYGFEHECASLRSVDFPLPYPPNFDQRPIHVEKEAVQAGRPSEMLENGVRQAVAAIEQDGADALIIGCSAGYWMRAHLQRRLDELGFDVPVLEGYRSAILQAKLLVELKRTVSFGYAGRGAKRSHRQLYRF